eukprot:6492749-Amphidinium_carterae.4
MDSTDYVRWKMERGLSREQAMAAWEEALQDPAIDGEGSGPTRSLWIAKNKERHRDTIKYMDAGTEEGAKQFKDPALQDRTNLLNSIVAGGSVSHTDEWLRNKDAAAAALPVEDCGGVGTKEDGAAVAAEERKAEVALAAPKAQEKMARLVPDLEKQAQAALASAEEVLTRVGADEMADPTTSAYHKTVSTRKCLLALWAAGGVDVLSEGDES